MEEAVGLSYLYPALPIMNVLSMVLCLLLTPGLWKTRIVALIAPVVWIFLGNLITFIGMIQWRGNTNDVLILAGVVAVFWRMWPVGCFASTACFAHFTWQRLQPLSMRQLYDTRRRNNWIHFVACVIVPVLWVPLSLLSCSRRYKIIEDFGPVMNVRLDWLGFMINRVPLILSYLVGITFNTLALVTYWRMKREDIESDLLKDRSSVRTRKLLLQALLHILLAASGIFKSVHDWANLELVAPSSFAENVASLQHVIFSTRSDMMEVASIEDFINVVVPQFAIPLLGFYFFAWFGCGEEARKAYRDALMKPVRLMGLAVEEHQPHVGSSPFPWSCIIPRRPRLLQGLANSLPHTRPNAPQVTPSREPPRRLSMHQPPTATLNPANAISSASDIPLRRLSYHKPPFIPLEPPNILAIAAPDVEGMDSARRQNKFTLLPPPRRISYHKPTFVPLAPANAGAVANGLEPTVPLVEAPRDRISDRNANLQAGSVFGSEAPPPPFSSPSSSTAPPPFSALVASIAPPPPFSSPYISTAPPPPFSSPPNSTAPPLLGASPSALQALPTPTPPHVEEASNTRQQEISALASCRAPRLSYHKPPFVPLGRPNGSAITTPGAPGSTPPRMEGMNNTRRQEKFAPRPQPRRLSYHKSAFVPLARTNDTSGVATASGPTVPLVEVPRDLIGDRNARLQPEGALDTGVAPPPFSSPSISTAPPPFSAPFASMTPPPAFLSPSTSVAPPPPSDVSTPLSTPSTRTPAPPYQYLNPFHDRAL